MKKTTGILAAIVLLACTVVSPLFASDDLAPFAGKSGAIRIAGGTAHIPVMKEAAKQIQTVNSDIQISIAGGGSGLGIKQAGEGLVDIGNAGRKPTDQEIEKYDLNLFKWAIDGVGAVVNPENEVKALSSKQLQAIYAGTIKNWKEVGGVDREINLYTRDEASGTRSVFWKKALNKIEMSQGANVVVSNGAMKTAVANDPYAIGFVSVGHIDKSVAPIALDGVTPTHETVQSGDYKVARGLYSMTKGTPSELEQLLLDYILSPSGQAIVASKGFIPVK